MQKREIRIGRRNHWLTIGKASKKGHASNQATENRPRQEKSMQADRKNIPKKAPKPLSKIRRWRSIGFTLPPSVELGIGQHVIVQKSPDQLSCVGAFLLGFFVYYAKCYKLAFCPSRLWSRCPLGFVVELRWCRLCGSGFKNFRREGNSKNNFS